MVCVDNLKTGSLENIAHLLLLGGGSEPNFEYVEHDVSTHISVGGELDEVHRFASPASPADFSRIPIVILKVGALGSPQLFGPRSRQGCALHARLDLGGLRRPAGAPPAEGPLGQRQPYWSARRPRRGQARYAEASRWPTAATTGSTPVL